MGATGLETLAPNLHVASRPLRLVVGSIGTRMTVVRLTGGSLFLHSPVRLDPETRRALDALGPVGFIVAPNKAHHFFVDDYVRAYPEARLFGAPGLAEKRKDLRFDAVLGDEAPPAWRDEIDQRLFRGAPILNEVAFLHRPTQTLLLTDLVFNVPASRTADARIFYWLSGAAGRFGPHRFVRWMIRDRAAARESLREILRWDFDRVILTHGEVLETGGKERLARAFAFCGAGTS